MRLFSPNSKMLDPRCITFIVGLLCLARVLDASAGDADPIYRTCTGECERTGCVGEMCFTPCKYLLDHSSTEAPWYMQKPLYLRLKQLDCKSECRYHCMIEREKERRVANQVPVKYQGKWPFQRLFGLQEPVSVAFSFLNLVMHFYGWLCYFNLVYYKLPLKHDKPYYDFAGLWHIYGLLSMNSWFWSAVFHSRDVEFTERLDYSSAVALLGFSLILSLIRSFGIKDEAGRVMVSAPLIAFTTTHILYLNNFRMDYGWNMKVCVAMGVAQLLVWAVWARVTRHPSRWKLWIVVVGGALAMLLEIYDFPPYKGFVDAHALWHATTIPLTYIWWRFIRDDAEFRTSNLVKKAK